MMTRRGILRSRPRPLLLDGMKLVDLLPTHVERDLPLP
jgi:hypothetical protein